MCTTSWLVRMPHSVRRRRLGATLDSRVVGLDLAQECGFRAGNLAVRGLSVRTRRDDHGDVRKLLIGLIAVPLAGLALYPAAGDRSLLYLSLAGYVAAIVALFGLLLLRFRLWIAAVITLGAILLPPLRSHSSYPLTDSWGLALETSALAAALL